MTCCDSGQCSCLGYQYSTCERSCGNRKIQGKETGQLSKTYDDNQLRLCTLAKIKKLKIIMDCPSSSKKLKDYPKLLP